MITAVYPPGPAIPGISPGVIIEGGRLMILSGHVPMDAEGRIPDSLEAQGDQVFANLQATLKAAGGGLENLARLTFYVCNYHLDQLQTIRSLRDRWITQPIAPASALIGAASLFHPDVLIEIDGIAVLPG